MRYRRIAGTDIDVSEVGFGVWTVAAGWWGAFSDDEAAALMREALDLGVTFFDTAETYGNGRGETVLAHAFPGAARDQIVIGAKFGYDWQQRPADRQAGHQEARHCWDPPFLEGALRGSLQRLGTDRIDHWQLHNPRMDALQRDDLWTFLDKVQREGHVRSIGVALGPAIGWREEGEFAMAQRSIHSVQMIYNALELDPGRALLDAARASSTSLLVRVPHSSGMLEGHYTADTVFPENDHRRHRPRAWLLNGIKKIEQLRFLTEDGATLGQKALRYVLRDPHVASALPNIYNREQLVEFAAASDVADVTDAQAATIEALHDSNYGLPVEQEAGLNPETRRRHEAAAGAKGAASR
ncbi:MAG: aldo/keto reductase [Chloroflexota bacterium]|nr:aldo/keto reductase [Chloroflexota bacterium]